MVSLLSSVLRQGSAIPLARLRRCDYCRYLIWHEARQFECFQIPPAEMPDAQKPVLEGNEAITQGNREGFLVFCTQDGMGIRRRPDDHGKEAVLQWMADHVRGTPVFTA